MYRQAIYKKPLVFTKPHVWPPPKCNTCVYFNKGNCNAFTSQDPVSGTVHHFEVADIRLNKGLCGPTGEWYIFKQITDLVATD